jgi:hypothetical protein
MREKEVGYFFSKWTRAGLITSGFFNRDVCFSAEKMAPQNLIHEVEFAK